MKFKNILLILIVFVFCLGCDKTPTKTSTLIDWSNYRSNFSSSEFKEAIIGKWISVFEHQGKENVEYLELSRYGKAIVMIKKDINGKTHTGDYSIHFSRPPRADFVTLAELTIKTSKGDILLSRINFGLHNGVLTGIGPFLRIDREPYGVLEKFEMNKTWPNPVFKIE